MKMYSDVWHFVAAFNFTTSNCFKTCKALSNFSSHSASIKIIISFFMQMYSLLLLLLPKLCDVSHITL